MHPMFLNQLNKITLYLCLLILFSCASVKAPQGGPLDSEPPKLISTSPAILTDLTQGQKITLSFNEFIKEKSLKNAIEIFPNIDQKIVFGNNEIKFDIDQFKKKCLIEGLDDIALSLEKKSKIELYEKKLKLNKPWVFSD